LERLHSIPIQKGSNIHGDYGFPFESKRVSFESSCQLIEGLLLFLGALVSDLSQTLRKTLPKPF